MVGIVAYYATTYFIKTQNDINALYIILILILSMTSITTILQYYNNPIGWQMGLFINEYKDGMDEKIFNYGLYQETLLGASYAIGIFGHPVTNAMFIAAISPLPMFKIITCESIIKRIIYFAIFVMGLTACFMTQQRSAFYILLITSIIIIIYYSKNKFLLTISGVLLVTLAWSTISDIIFSEDLGRLSISNLQTDSARQILWANAESFIHENLLWGGPMTFMSMNNGLPAHNFFLSAFIYSGLFGGFAIIFLFLKICKDTISIILENRHKINHALIFSISLMVFLTQGMAHNGTLIDGEALIFILLAASVSSHKLK